MKPISSFILPLLAALMLSLPATALSHCQVPCGIYDDPARVQLMLEDSQTVIKAVTRMGELSGKTDPQSRNQMVRWIMNKEKHARNIISVICDYFLTQRVKPDQVDYGERLKKHHAVIVAAMEAKQKADMAHARNLEKAVQALAPYYHH